MCDSISYAYPRFRYPYCSLMVDSIRIKAAKGTAPRAPQEEADSLCDSFSQRYSPENLHEDTIAKPTQMAPARIRTITKAAYEPVDTDQEFTFAGLEEVVYRMILNDIAPGDNTVCYSMIKNAPLATRKLFLINQSFTAN